MGCKSCSKHTQGVCDVCQLVDGNSEIKVVVFCKQCDAWICKNCENNWFRRSVAYFKRKFT